MWTEGSLLRKDRVMLSTVRKTRSLAPFSYSQVSFSVSFFADFLCIVLTFTFLDALMIAKSEKKESLDMKQFVRFHPSTNVRLSFLPMPSSLTFWIIFSLMLYHFQVVTDSEGAFKMAKAGKDKDFKIEIIDTASPSGPDCITLNFKYSFPSFAFNVNLTPCPHP